MRRTSVNLAQTGCIRKSLTEMKKVQVFELTNWQVIEEISCSWDNICRKLSTLPI